MINKNDIYSHLVNGGDREELFKAFEKEVKDTEERIKKEQEEAKEKEKREKILKAAKEGALGGIYNYLALCRPDVELDKHYIEKTLEGLRARGYAVKREYDLTGDAENLSDWFLHHLWE